MKKTALTLALAIAGLIGIASYSVAAKPVKAGDCCGGSCCVAGAACCE